MRHAVDWAICAATSQLGTSRMKSNRQNVAVEVVILDMVSFRFKLNDAGTHPGVLDEEHTRLRSDPVELTVGVPSVFDGTAHRRRCIGVDV